MRVIRAVILLGFFCQHARGEPVNPKNDSAIEMHNVTENKTEDTKAVTVTATPVSAQGTEKSLMTPQGSIAGSSPSPTTVTSSGGSEPSSTTDFRSSTHILTTSTSPTPGDKRVSKAPHSSSTVFTPSTVSPSPVQTTKATEVVLSASTSYTTATTGMSSKPRLTTKTMVHITQKTSASTSGSVNQYVLTTSTSATKSTAIALGMRTTTTSTAVNTFQKPFNMTFSTEDDRGKDGQGEEDLYKICQKLMKDMQKAECSLKGRYGENSEIIFEGGVIRVSPTLLEEYYKDLKSTPDNTTLIAVLASCSALLAVIIGLAVYAVCHCRANRKDQQHLTEELQTVENGYHDNPTLEVMEVQPEMQEKVALGGELNSSWIVPGNSLPKEDIPDEEDTHL
ncbi:podocalyxin-like [Anguilla anguilla]|uniref:podocalyxin-like n=1 Tax=Anguilla anguilla TaxID=7936 RepID=UPI0015B0A6CF|nr:podocalyxin-like [Anguilla anguilla]